MEVLQRDVALMQEDIRTLQRSFDQQMAALKTLTQQAVDNSVRISTSVGVMQTNTPAEIKREVNAALVPVAGLNARFDQVAGQLQTLSDAVQALNASMQQLHSQLNDLKNVVAAIQVAPPPPPPTDPNAPNAAASAPTVPLDTLYQNALRDMNGGKPDLALSEFANCVKWYQQEPLAASCQFYIGSIHGSKGDFEDAVKDYDAVLEQFPKGERTADAFYYKGLALVKMGRSKDARKEFLAVIQQYPKSAAADRAREQMKALGFNTPVAAKRKKMTTSPLPASSSGPESATPTPSYNTLLDYLLLRPDWTEGQVIDACEKAERLALHCVIVRPCDVDAAVRTGVRVGSVCGWPFGDQTTGVKLYEARDLLRRGAKEIDFVLNPSRLLSRQFQNVEMELLQAVEACHKEGAEIKIVFPPCALNFEVKLIGARICSRVGPNFAVVSSEADVPALRPHFAEDIGIKFASIASRAELERLLAAGCTRFGSENPEEILVPPQPPPVTAS